MPEMSAEMDGKNRLEEGEHRMKCPKCGQEAVGNFCSNCGTPLVNDTVRREQETVGRKQENSYDDGDSEQRNPARMESDEKKAESGSGSKRNSQEKRSSQSQDAQKREEERRDNERCQSQAQEDARRDREAAIAQTTGRETFFFQRERG